MSDQLLAPSLSSLYEVLAKSGACYYIPAYQRSFAWVDEDIERLLEDVVDGIRAACKEQKENGDEVTFLGTIVCFEDGPTFKMVDPYIDNDLPAQILVVIDGQQRLTVALMFCVIMHDILRRTKFKFDKQGREDDPELERQRLKIMAQLETVLINTEATGDQPYYPRMIRGGIDKWSTNSNKCNYESPISALISRYKKIIESGDCSELRMKNNGNFEKKFNLMKKYINELVFQKKYANNNDTTNLSSGYLPEISQIFSAIGAAALKNLFSITASEDFFGEARKNLEQVLNSQTASDEKKINKLRQELDKQHSVGRALLLCAYFLTRIMVIKMVTVSDEYAYRIFDSLNTTGDPLTAFETFKPEVIKSAGGAMKYSGSKHEEIIEEISQYFDKLDKKQQADKTKNFIVQFALAEDGTKLRRDLSDQRKYLMDRYDDNLEFIKCMLYSKRVFESFNPLKPERFDTTKFFSFLSEKKYFIDDEHMQWSNQAKFCLSFIIGANHSICAALLSRFYSVTLSETNTASAQVNHLELCKAICSIAAFFAVWRISRPTTANIDSHHRRIMRKGNDEHPELNFMRKNGNPPNFSLLNDEFTRLLKSHEIWTINDSSSWIELSYSSPIYKIESKVAKFFLLLDAYHPDPSSPVSPNETNILNEDLWSHPAHSTIEHIKPQSSIGQGSTQDRERIHSIGNLTLLPATTNSIIQDASWNIKRPLYEFISCTDPDKYEAIAAKAELTQEQKEEINKIFDSLREKIKNTRLPYIEHITQYDEFNYYIIDERGKKILANAWNIIKKWINLPSSADGE